MPIIPRSEKTQALGAPRLNAQIGFDAPKTIIPDTSQHYDKLQGVAFRMAKEAKVKADKTSIIDAQTKIDAWENQNLYGEGGAFSKRGKDTLELHDSVGESFRTFSSDLRDNLHQMVSQRKSSMDRSLMKYTRKEMDAYNTAQADAGLESAANRAITGWMDPDVVGESLAQGYEIIDANPTGASPEVQSLKKQTFESGVYAGVLLQKIETEQPDAVLAAKSDFQILKKNKKLLPEHIQDIENMLDAQAPKAVASARYDKMKSELLSFKPEEVPMEKIVEIADDLDKKEPGSGDFFFKMINADRKIAVAKAKQEKDNFETYLQEIISKNDGDYTILSSADLATAGKLGIDVTKFDGASDPDVENYLDSLSSEQLRTVDLDDEVYKQRLSFDKRKEYEGKQQNLGTADGKYVGGLVDSTVALYFREETGVDPEANKATKARVARYKRQLESAIEAYGGTITPKVVDELGRSIMKNRSVVYDPPGMLNKQKVKDITQMTIDKVPDEDFMVLRDSLIRANKPVTEETIIRMYVEGLRAMEMMDAQ